MPMNLSIVKTAATEAVVEELAKLYENSDKEGMQDFANAIAEAAVVAVQHVIDFAETELSGESIR